MNLLKSFLVFTVFASGVVLFRYSQNISTSTLEESKSNTHETSQDEVYVGSPYESDIESNKREEAARTNRPAWFKKLSPEEQQEFLAQIDQEEQIQAEIQAHQETEVLDESAFGIVNEENVQEDL